MATSIASSPDAHALSVVKSGADIHDHGSLVPQTISVMSNSFVDHRSTIWNDLLSSQVALFAEAEFQHLENLPGWKEAHSVADIGCGNGDYIAHVANTFPEKSYVGFDTSDKLVSIARQKFDQDDIIFHCMDIQDASPHSLFDCAILRFVVQHLQNPLDFFGSLRKLIHPNGFVVIIEPNLEASSSTPELKNFNALIKAYEALAKNLGSTRAKLKDHNGLHQLIGNSWQISNVEQIHSTHCREGWNKTGVAQILNGWVNIIEASQYLAWDYSSLRMEIEDWLNSSGQQIDIALNATTLRAANH